jgi:hypothetical protein
MEWNIATCQSRITEEELPELQDMAFELLDFLQRSLPDKTGEKGKWNFKKAHSILHKDREIILWGNLDNTSCRGPKVYHYIPMFTWYIRKYTLYIRMCTWYTLVPTESVYHFCQHAHIDKIKQVANLTNIKNVFMYILRFHAHADYLQTHETLLKELQSDDDLIRVRTALNPIRSRLISMLWNALHLQTVI